ncbi:peptidyl-prolyl cis-trans isomerase B-like [Diadema antillarum]|uniref:peptidyl-prolyl cis-trans isomerase B-like n=1 Tax=Diadema antillarum TaxID=105358 RepID=UPI003A8C7055
MTTVTTRTMKVITLLLLASVALVYFVTSSDVKTGIESSVVTVITENGFFYPVTSDKEVRRNVSDLLLKSMSKPTKNFAALAIHLKVCGYQGSKFHLVVIQGGDFPRGDDTGGKMTQMTTGLMMTTLKPNYHGPGWMSMTNVGRNVSGLLFSMSKSTTIETSWLDGKHIVW